MSLTTSERDGSTLVKTDNEYFKIHQYLVRTYGKASECESPDCQFKSPKRFEWALFKGRKYSRNIEDYIQLCASCHRKYDYTEEHRQKLSKAKKGKPANHQKPVSQYSADGEFLASFKCTKDAAKATNTNRTSISACISGKYKSANGYLWKR